MKPLKPIYPVYLTIFVMTFYACRKDVGLKIETENEPTKSSATFHVQVNCNAQDLIKDSVYLMNAAGNVYSLHRLNFYISNINFISYDNSICKSEKYFYIDPLSIQKSSFTLDSITIGNYKAIQFDIGLDSSLNHTFQLNNTIDNMNMIWPDAMGGGYHFLKMEGNYIDTSNLLLGYAIHIGKNGNKSTVTIQINLNQQKGAHNYTLDFDINEIFKTPYTYNLNIDGNSTMTDSIAISKIKTNIQDAFTITQNY